MNSQSIRNSLAQVLDAVRVDDVPAVEAGNGCYRRDIASTAALESGL